VVENAKRQEGMILLQRLQRELLTKEPKSRFCGVWREWPNWAIYSLCGFPRPDGVFKTSERVGLGNVRNGHARPDEIDYPSERWWQRTWVWTYNKTCLDDEALHMSRLPENTVRTTMLHPSGRSTLKHQKCWEKYYRTKFLKTVSEHACIINW
jgi:hypothetical protein